MPPRRSMKTKKSMKVYYPVSYFIKETCSRSSKPKHTYIYTIRIFAAPILFFGFFLFFFFKSEMGRGVLYLRFPLSKSKFEKKTIFLCNVQGKIAFVQIKLSLKYVCAEVNNRSFIILPFIS